MMIKYDLERFLEDIEAILVDQLNDKLVQIDTEKADDIILKPVDDGAYFLQELNSRVANYDPFVVYSIESMEPISTLGGTASKVTVSIVLIIADNGQDIAITKRILRYSRALKEVIEENFALDENGINLEVQSLVPVEFQRLNTSENYRAVGINVIGTLA
jgi:hypothetical protein